MKHFWINIESSHHRHNFMTDQFQKLEIDNERIDAFTPDSIKNFTIKRNPKSINSDKEIACILSHIKAIQKGYEQNLEYFIVCEDDMFIPSLKESTIVQCMKIFEHKMSCSIDLLQFFINGHPFIIQLYNEYFVEQRELFKEIKEHIYSSTGYYLISREGAKKMLDKICQPCSNNNILYDLSQYEWCAADNVMYDSVNSFAFTYPLTISNTMFLSEIHIDHLENHVIANTIIKHVHKKNNKLNLFVNTDKNKQVKMVLHSGMCNQMFMIFATIAYSIQNKMDYIFYSHITKSMDNYTPNYFHNLVNKIKHKTTMYIDNDIPSYLENDFEYKPIPQYNGSFNMKGFFQSYKYFENEFNEIMDITGIRQQRQNIRNEYCNIFNGKPCISIHFRIGDYQHLQQNHPIVAIEYYQNSLKYLEKCINLHNYNILYFCQECDNQIVTECINKLNQNNYTFIKVNDDIPDWKQMLMISLCHHHIIANSTFSWWGAYICNNKDKIVCTPLKKWFGPALAKHNTKDLCPPEWIIIDF